MIEWLIWVGIITFMLLLAYIAFIFVGVIILILKSFIDYYDDVNGFFRKKY